MAWKGKKMKTKVIKSNKQKIREMTILAMFIAIIAIMGFIPNLGFITIGLISYTIIPIPVLIGGVLLGRKSAIWLGLAFGVVSMIRGATSAGFDYLFIFPWVSVLPRFIFGLVIYDIYRFFLKVIRIRFVALVVSFFILSMIHSLLVLPMLVTAFPIILGNANMGSIVGSEVLAFISDSSSLSASIKLIFGILISNSLIEALLAASIGSIIADRLIAFRLLDTNNMETGEE